MNRSTTGRVLVYGAAGHTGRFVVAELLGRGITPVVAGRTAGRLETTPGWETLEQRIFTVHDPERIGAALADVEVVVNCAGPFLDTALPLAAAAVASGAHYLDVTAEQPVVQTLYRELDRPARDAGVTVVPAMAFYGGLADLLATTALDGDEHAEVTIAVGLDHWWPTEGTRITGERNTAVRQVVRDGVLVPLESPAPTSTWSFPGVLGDQPVVELPFSEAITIPRHLRVDRLTSYLNASSLAELRDSDTPAPSAADDGGRSPQQFVVHVVARGGGGARQVSASGRDIYAITGPIVAEGVVRLLDGRVRGAGALPPGAAFDADDVLAALAAHLDGVRIDPPSALGRPASQTSTDQDQENHMTTFGPQLIGETEKSLQAILRRVLAEPGLTEPQWVTLRLAGQLDGDKPLATAVAERAHFADAVALVRELEERGLVDDNRISPAGRELLERLGAQIKELTAPIWAGLPSDDVATTERVLNRVVARARSTLDSM